MSLVFSEPAHCPAHSQCRTVWSPSGYCWPSCTGESALPACRLHPPTQESSGTRLVCSESVNCSPLVSVRRSREDTVAYPGLDVNTLPPPAAAQCPFIPQSTSTPLCCSASFSEHCSSTPTPSPPPCVLPPPTDAMERQTSRPWISDLTCDLQQTAPKKTPPMCNGFSRTDSGLGEELSPPVFPKIETLTSPIGMSTCHCARAVSSPFSDFNATSQPSRIISHSAIVSSRIVSNENGVRSTSVKKLCTAKDTSTETPPPLAQTIQDSLESTTSRAIYSQERFPTDNTWSPTSHQGPTSNVSTSGRMTTLTQVSTQTACCPPAFSPYPTAPISQSTPSDIPEHTLCDSSFQHDLKPSLSVFPHKQNVFMNMPSTTMISPLSRSDKATQPQSTTSSDTSRDQISFDTIQPLTQSPCLSGGQPTAQSDYDKHSFAPNEIATETPLCDDSDTITSFTDHRSLSQSTEHDTENFQTSMHRAANAYAFHFPDPQEDVTSPCFLPHADMVAPNVEGVWSKIVGALPNVGGSKSDNFSETGEALAVSGAAIGSPLFAEEDPDQACAPSPPPTQPRERSDKDVAASPSDHPLDSVSTFPSEFTHDTCGTPTPPPHETLHSDGSCTSESSFVTLRQPLPRDTTRLNPKEEPQAAPPSDRPVDSPCSTRPDPGPPSSPTPSSSGTILSSSSSKSGLRAKGVRFGSLASMDLETAEIEEQDDELLHQRQRLCRRKSMGDYVWIKHVKSFTCNYMSIPDPSNQKLNWTKPPLSVLIIRKHLDDTVLFPFRDLVVWLVEEKKMLVYVEHTVLEEPILAGCPQYKQIQDRLSPFKEGDDLTNKVDLIICLGGDGTLLYASSLFQTSVPPVMAFNMGSLGFLTPFQFYEDFKSQVTKVLMGTASLLLRYRLKCVVVKHEAGPLNDSIPHVKNIQKEHSSLKTHKMVLNEVVVDRGPSSYLCNLDLYIEGRRVTSVQGDGLIISTPTGSTAYAVAAGASMIHPSVPCILLTPICPHSLSFRPIVVPAGVEIKVCLSSDARGTAMVSFDGRDRQEIHQGDSLRITTASYPVPSICAMDQIEDWFDGLAVCLNWNIRRQQRPLTMSNSLTSLDSTDSEAILMPANGLNSDRGRSSNNS